MERTAPSRAQGGGPDSRGGRTGPQAHVRDAARGPRPEEWGGVLWGSHRPASPPDRRAAGSGLWWEATGRESEGDGAVGGGGGVGTGSGWESVGSEM